MMSYAWLFHLILTFMQIGELPGPPDGLNPLEKSKLDNEGNIERRIKIYEVATQRIQITLEKTITAQNLTEVPLILKTWKGLLSRSLKDIEANVKRKNKSRALIRYEIQLRKAILDVQNYKLRSPVEQQNDIEDWMSGAESAHRTFVDILFHR